MACVKKRKLDKNQKYEKLTLQNKLKFIKWLDSRENITQIFLMNQSFFVQGQLNVFTSFFCFSLAISQLLIKT